MTPVPEPPNAHPIARFVAAFEAAKRAEAHDASAVILATADARGRPSARVVLLKGADERGFTFYTNRESRKAKELAENPFAALCAHWPAGHEQVRVEGPVAPIDDAESDAYFATRPRESQLGAWASQQSAPLGSREELEARVREIAARFPREVPRPPRWGGYRLTPERIEFWYEGPARLHDRFLYTRDGDLWVVTRLDP